MTPLHTVSSYCVALLKKPGPIKRYEIMEMEQPALEQNHRQASAATFMVVKLFAC